LAARNVCISRYLERRLRPPRSATIYNAVAARAYSDDEYVEGHEGRLAFAGRLVAEKGLDVLIRALPALPDSTSLDVVGAGPMAAPWRLLAQELDLNDRVRFLGAMTFDGVAEVYRAASVVVVPTVCEEAFGYAAAEAMALRRPVVATPSGALTELCESGRGFVAADMTPASLAASVAAALVSGDERRAAANAGHRFAREAFAIDVVGRAYERLYEEVAG
jgi:glycosyltransferase involved in cell wall biosynthesis